MRGRKRKRERTRILGAHARGNIVYTLASLPPALCAGMSSASTREGEMQGAVGVGVGCGGQGGGRLTRKEERPRRHALWPSTFSALMASSGSYSERSGDVAWVWGVTAMRRVTRDDRGRQGGEGGRGRDAADGAMH